MYIQTHKNVYPLLAESYIDAKTASREGVYGGDGAKGLTQKKQKQM